MRIRPKAIAIFLILACATVLSNSLFEDSQPTTTVLGFSGENKAGLKSAPAISALPNQDHNLFLSLLGDCWIMRTLLESPINFAGDAKILGPANCTTGLLAESEIIVHGTYENIPPHTTLWVLAYAPNALYYAQSPNACQGARMFQENGQWQVPVFLGEKGGQPEWFDIVVIVANEGASQFLDAWLIQGCQDGFEGIPGDLLAQFKITEKASIAVQTQD